MVQWVSVLQAIVPGRVLAIFPIIAFIHEKWKYNLKTVNFVKLFIQINNFINK